MIQEFDIPKAVNWHCEAYCNYNCKFCYARFETQRTLPRLSEEEGFDIIKKLVDAGVEKINFVGGDVVEVSPPFDVNNMTSLVGATIAFEMLCTMTKVN